MNLGEAGAMVSDLYQALGNRDNLIAKKLVAKEYLHGLWTHHIPSLPSVVRSAGSSRPASLSAFASALTTLLHSLNQSPRGNAETIGTLKGTL
jgi:hypothetical protein